VGAASSREKNRNKEMPNIFILTLLLQTPQTTHNTQQTTTNTQQATYN
jgi:hypothetical protein